MPVTHGVAGSSPVQTAILEKAFLNGKAFLFFGLTAKELRLRFTQSPQRLFKFWGFCLGYCSSNIAQGFNLRRIVMIYIVAMHCTPMIETIGYGFNKNFAFV